MNWLVIIDSQDCETQNTILGVYSSKLRAIRAIVDDYIMEIESDKNSYDDIEIANALVQELVDVLQNNSSIYYLRPMEIDKNEYIE